MVAVDTPRLAAAAMEDCHLCKEAGLGLAPQRVSEAYTEAQWREREMLKFEPVVRKHNRTGERKWGRGTMTQREK